MSDNERMPWCETCGMRKSPVGRSVPIEMANSLCNDDCDGYRKDPQPSGHWIGEECAAFSNFTNECAICGAPVNIERGER